MDDFRRRAVLIGMVGAGAAGGLALTWMARYVLLLLFAGIVGAVLISMGIDRVEGWKKMPRLLAFALVLITAGGLMGLGLWLRGPALAEQLSGLEVQVPAAARQLQSEINRYALGRWLIASIAESLQGAGFAHYALVSINRAMVLTGATVAALFLALIMSLYLAAEPRFYLKGLYRVVPAWRRGIVHRCLGEAERWLRRWLIAKLLSMVVIGAFVTAGLLVLRVPMAGTLGVLAAVLTFIPNLGPILSVIPAALLAFAVSPVKGMLVIALYCGAHILDGNLVTPLAERSIVTLPPALTLGFQLLLAALAGGLGVALAAPLLAALMGVVQPLLAAHAGHALGSMEKRERKRAQHSKIFSLHPPLSRPGPGSEAGDLRR